MKAIRDYLAEGKPLLFDGAMGTFFAAQFGRSEERVELANLREPEAVRGIHAAYVEAGAEAIKTNTFSLSVDFSEGREELAEKLISSGVRLAREATGDRAYVFADLGPVPEDSSRAAGEVYIREAELFLREGVDGFLIETLQNVEGIAELADYLRTHCPETVLIASFAVGPDGVTRSGEKGRQLLLECSRIPGVDAVGFNCLSGPRHLRQLLENLDLGGKLLSVMPNAGYPTVLGHRTVYSAGAEYFAEEIDAILRNGAAIVGGCCGTEPEYISKIAEKIRGNVGKIRAFGEAGKEVLKNSGKADDVQSNTLASSLGSGLREAVKSHPTTASKHQRPSAITEVSEAQPLPASGKIPTEISAESPAETSAENPLWEKLKKSERVVVVELDPPVNDDNRSFLRGVQLLRDAGADAVTIADCPIGRPRADSSLLACKIKRELGIEPLPHLNCRDRNLNAMKALLLGLSMEHIHNVLLVTGDPIPTEARDEVKSVFNFNSRKLARYILDLNRETLQTPFRMFGALNLNAANFHIQLKLAKEKEGAGISGFLTQPILSEEAMENLRLAREALKGKILAGIFPVVSYRNALFLNNEVAGIRVSEDIAKKYEGKSREDCEEIAVETSLSIIKKAEAYCDGFYLMTPFQRVELMGRILGEITN